MSGRQAQPYQPRTPHKGRPDGLQPIINRLPDAIWRIWQDLSRAYALSTGLYLLKLDVSRDRSRAFLSNLSDFLCVLLDYCQPKEGGLIAVPYGKIKMPLTKCRRKDFKDGTSKDFMRGLAELSGFSVGTCYGMFWLLRHLCIVVHGGYYTCLSQAGKPIRISRYCIPLPVRQWLSKVTQTPDVWAKRDAKLAAKAAREYFTATPEKPGDRGTMPKEFADRIALRKQQTGAVIDDSKTRTRLTNQLMEQHPAEPIKDILSRVMAKMPQAP